MSTYPPPTSDTPIFDPARFLTIDEALIEELREVLPNLSAVAPNNNNPFIFAINNTLVVKNDDTAPTASITLDADNSGTDFGLYFVGGGKPFNFETLDAEALQIKDTTLSLYDSGTPQTTDITATDISIVGGNSATWANIINNVGGGIPSLSQVLTVGQSAGNQNISGVNVIEMNDALTYLTSASLYFGANNGAITGLTTINGLPYPPTPLADNLTQVLTAGNNASGLNMGGIGDIALSTINGSPYPPTYSTPDLNSVLSTGNSANSQNITSVNDISLYSINGTPYPPYPFAPYGLTDTLTYNNNAGGLSMTNINNIDLSTINGAPYPPNTPTQDLNTTLSYGNSVGPYNINMNSQNIETANDVGLVSINGIPYLPAKFSAVFPSFDVGIVSNNSTSYGGINVIIPAGSYQITYTIQLDGNITQGGGQYYMVRGYCFIQGAVSGIFTPTMVNTGFMPSQVISYAVGGGYYNCLTATDYITIPSQDTFQLGVYQSNEQNQFTTSCFISAVFQAV